MRKRTLLLLSAITTLVVLSSYPAAGSAGRTLQLLDSLWEAQQAAPIDWPYDQLVASLEDPRDVRALEAIRQWFDQHGENGNRRLLGLFQHQLQQKPVALDSFERTRQQLQFGALLRNSNYYLPDSIIVYRAIGKMYLGAIADSLQARIDGGAYRQSDEKMEYIRQFLADNQYSINVPVSNWTKLIHYLKDGRYEYVLRKLTGTYLHVTLTAGGTGLLLLLIPIFWIRKRNRKETLSS